VGEDSDAAAITRSLDYPDAFGVLFDRYATTMHRYLLRRVGPDDADTLNGEVFRIAFERRADYDARRPNARPWLYGIATNLVADHRRRETRREHGTRRLAAEPARADDVAERVVDALTARQVSAPILEAIRGLPDGERDVITLRAFADLSYADIAEALAVPVGTVRSRLNRSRARLRELPAARDEQLTHADVFIKEKERLMADITGSHPGDVEHRSRMYPRLAYRDELAALEYLTRVFGFTERREARIGTGEGDDHMLAWLEFGAGLVMIGHSNTDVHLIHSPADLGATTCMINVEVDDVDAHYERAVAEGAEITMPLEDAWYGARRYEATDLGGHRWHFDERHDHIRARGGEVPEVTTVC